MTTPRTPGRLANLLLLLALWGVWGYNWVVTKEGLNYAGPFALAVGRSVLAVATLGLVLLLSGRSLRPPPWRPTLLIALTQTAGFTALTNLALLFGGAGKVSVLCYTMPFWTLLFAWVFLGERVRGWQWLGVGLALAGLVLILEPWNLTSGSISNWLALAGGICWAASAILIKRMRRQGPVDPLGLTFWQMVWGTLPLTALWWMMPGPPVVWGWPLLLVLLFAGCLAGGLGWLVWTLLLSRLSAGTASLNILAIPGVAVLAAWLQLGEVPDMFESMGMLLIALALAVLAFLTIKGERRLKGLAQARPEKCK